MYCPNCGANVTSENVCSSCGAQLATSQEPAYTGTQVLSHKVPIISGSFTAGKAFAIIGCICYLLYIFMGISEGGDMFVRGMAYAFAGITGEEIAWVYILALSACMILLPVGLSMFSSGASRGDKKGVNVIIAALVIYLVCSVVNMIHFYSEYAEGTLQTLGNVIENIESMPGEMAVAVMSSLYMMLFLTIIEPILCVFWSISAIQGANAIGRNITFKQNSSRPPIGASSLGKTLGVMRLLNLLAIVLMIVSVAENVGGSFFGANIGASSGEDEIMPVAMMLGYIAFAIMPIAFGAYFNRMRRGDNYYSE